MVDPLLGLTGASKAVVLRQIGPAMSLFATPEESPFVFGAYAAHLNQTVTSTPAVNVDEEHPQDSEPPVLRAPEQPGSAAA
jgi:hypothetical protein